MSAGWRIYEGGGGASGGTSAGGPPMGGGSFVGGTSAGQGVIDLTRWGPLWDVLVRACGSCGEVLGQVAGSVGYGAGILGGLIWNPVVANTPEATWHPPKAVPTTAKEPKYSKNPICDQQYKRDLKKCGRLPKGQRNACYAQAMERLISCEEGKPLPPLPS